MRKKLLSFLAILLVAVLPVTCCHALSITLSQGQETASEDLSLPGVEGLTCAFTSSPAPAPGGVFTAEWTENGERYRLAIVGVPESLTEEEVRTLISARNAGVSVTLEDPALTDAEKYSNKLSGLCGTWVTDRGEDWGDSHKCWAGACANMLWLTGWAGRAVSPDTGLPFADEDEVFAYFSARTMNDGTWHPFGIRWFFTGQDADYAMHFSDWDAQYPALLSPAEPNDYLTTNVITPPEATPLITPEQLAELLLPLAQGAVGGINIGLDSIEYPLLTGAAYEGQTASINEMTGRYCVTVSDFGLTEEDPSLEKALYTYNPDGTVGKVLKTADGYADESGLPVEEADVLEGLIHRDEATGITVPATREANLDTWDWMMYLPVEESVLDLSSPICSYTPGSAHALTVTGALINLDRGIPEALFIADTDNSAAYYVLDDTNRRPESRPNIYTMCPIRLQKHDNGEELETVMELVGYLPGRTAVIHDATVLCPPAEGVR